ncbi:MAG: response regulator [Lentisphaeraceae bacterium]|nr:response regulator [Lentisphaeraceae bacterium]
MENHILIVDDNLNNLRIAVDILMNEDYRISTARNGMEALSVLSKTKVDLILLDINMPDMNGFEVIEKIKEDEKLKEVPVLFVTSHNDEVYLEKAFAAGCVDFIAKPYRPTEFLARIKTHVSLVNHKLKLQGLVKEKTIELENTINALEISKKAKDDFISVMSHELRTPLSGILGMIELLKVPELSHNKDEFLVDLESSAVKLSRLIADILDYSTIDTPSKLYESPSSTAHLIEQVELMIDNRLSNDIDFHLMVSDDLPMEVMIDFPAILKALEAIIDNAFKFTQKGNVCLNIAFNKLAKDKGEISFISSDNGPGIDEKYHKKIFEKFYQVDSGVNRLFEGTGLGLAIVKKTCDSLGGSVHIDSSIGKGSTFSLTIPVGITVSETAADAKKPVREANILIVEDLKTNQIFLKKILGLKECNVLIAEDYKECFKALEENHIDLIFMDFMLPEMDGTEITKKIRENGLTLDDLPIIAVTAKADDLSRAKCIESGMNAYISKPFSATDIFAILSHFFSLEE